MKRTRKIHDIILVKENTKEKRGKDQKNYRKVHVMALF